VVISELANEVYTVFVMRNACEEWRAKQTKHIKKLNFKQMKKILIFIAFLGFTYLGNAQFNNYSNGDIVNDFTVTDVYGNTHNLYEYTAAGKYVYLDFFFASCGGCKDFLPIFNELYDKYGCNEADLICIAINNGDDKDAEVIKFKNTYGGTFNHAPAISKDGGCEAVVADFDPMYYPAVCLIAPDNSMVDSNVSPYATVADLEAAFPSDFNPEVLACTIDVAEYSHSTQFEVYPNPGNGQEITIKLFDAKQASIRIYNILGKEVYAQILTQSEQKIYPNLQKGAYLLSVETKNSTRSKKLLIY